MGSPKPIEIDGRTGEGGGQVVRVAVALAAVTCQPIRIANVRGNRPSRSGGKGGGLKAQHVTAIRWLAEATEADVQGLEVGSSTLTFAPRIPPSIALNNKSRWIKIPADTGAASTLLILQAILPFLLYTTAAASDDEEEEPTATTATSTPVELEITGGTNVGMSLSYEYLDQVLMPRLEHVFDIKAERRLKQRGWSLGPQSRGSMCLTIHPLKRGQALRVRNQATTTTTQNPSDLEVRYVDVSMMVPSHLHSDLQNTLTKDISELLPSAEINFKIVQDSGHDARIYALLVARAARDVRWGRDILMSTPRKDKHKKDATVASLVSKKVVADLAKELFVRNSTCDEFLQDQLIVFQALAEGWTSFPRDDVAAGADVEMLQRNVAQLDLGLGERMRKDRTDKPFGHGSLHSQTVRWVASQILPAVEWYNNGVICKGVGIRFN